MNSWLENVKQFYLSKGSFAHRTPEKIRLFPFITHIPTDNVQAELKDFQGICGEVNRLLKNIEPAESFDMTSLLKNVSKKVETQHGTHLADIIKETAFYDDGRLFCFHPKTFYYRSCTKPEKKVSTIANFCINVLFEGQPEILPDYRDTPTENVFHKLILSCLPALRKNDKSKVNKDFSLIDVGLSVPFQKDISLMARNTKFATIYLPELLKFYYLLYQLRLLEKLNNLFGDKELEPIYFTLDWERLSKERVAYDRGWQRLIPTGTPDYRMWSHANCLELLNHLPLNGLCSPFTYLDIKNWTETANSQDICEAEKALDDLLSFYKTNIATLGFDWDMHNDVLFCNRAKTVIDKSHLLWRMVHCQFKHSGRKSAAEKYSSWLTLFVSQNYMKNRGRIGNTLAFNRQQLMFLSRLCIGDKGKLRLRELWTEFARRGVAFDFDSQRQIVTLFEKLNLLEKKSDSGDAQYVRAIF
jgi:DNA phosphorothioation-dependent restriction protein DptG